MKSIKLFLLLFCLTGLILSSCKSESSKKSDDNASNEKEEEEMNNENLEQSLGNLKEGEVVDFRVLKDALPENLAGLDRTSHTGQKTAFMSFKMSNAQANYSKGDQRIDATITDTGGMGMAMAGMAAWSQIEIDSETDDGYEKTTMIDGKKAFEKYNTKSKDGEISVIYNNRIILTLNASNVSMEDLHNAVKKIDIKI